MRGHPGRAFWCGLAGVLLGISLLLAPSAARAQTWKGLALDNRMREAAWHFGPFLIQPSLVIANAGVDSNIYYTPSDPVKDFTITAGPAVTVYIPNHRKTFVLSVYGSPQYVWYSKTEQERTWNYYFNGAAQINLKNAFFSVDGIYSDARERWNTEIDIRPRRIERGYGSSVLLKLAWKTSFAMGFRTVDYNYESIEYEGSNIQEELNRQESYANLSMYYQLGTERRLFLDFEYGRYDFEYPSQAALKNSESFALSGGVEFSQLARRVRGRLRLGYKKQDALSEGMPDYQGFVGDTELSFRVAKMFVLRGSYIRDIRFSLWYDAAYYLETRPGFGASLYPLSFLRLDYDYAFGRNQYPAVGGEGVARLDDYVTHTGGLYVRIMKDTALGFIVSWWSRDSNIPGEDDQRTFFGFNLTYEF